MRLLSGPFPLFELIDEYGALLNLHFDSLKAVLEKKYSAGALKLPPIPQNVLE
jgi:hypothetical protein